MRVLLAVAKADFGPRAEHARAQAQLRVGDKAEVVSAMSINWEQIKNLEGSWEGTYRWAAKNFDAVVLLETLEGGLGRGTYEIGQEFLVRGKPCGVLRGDKIERIARMTPNGAGSDWKLDFARVDVV